MSVVSSVGPALSCSEAAFTDLVVETARRFGWLVSHPRPARTKDGWRTAVQGDAGYPDLTMVHRVHGVVFAELKMARGRLAPAQDAWITELRAAGATVFVWRPADWVEILSVLAPFEG